MANVESLGQALALSDEARVITLAEGSYPILHTNKVRLRPFCPISRRARAAHALRNHISS